MDAVFKALSDPTRRSLLDELFERDGQSLKELERAGLVTTKRRGREKLHFLNPIPIRLVHDRWVSKYAEPWAAGLSGLKNELEEEMEKVFEIYINWTPGSTYKQDHPTGAVLGEGENLVVDPPRRLVQTMRALWSDEVKREGTS